MDVRLTWTDCDEAGDYVVPNVLSTRDLVSRPDNMDETVLHMSPHQCFIIIFLLLKCFYDDALTELVNHHVKRTLIVSCTKDYT